MRKSKKYRVRHGVARKAEAARRALLYGLIFALVLAGVCISVF